MENFFDINTDDLLNKKSLHIRIPEDERKTDFTLNIIESWKIKEHDFDVGVFTILKKYKTFIDEQTNHKWNKLKRFTNLFELISYSSSNKNIKPFINYIPMSRAYFKLHEILINYDLLKDEPLNYAALAEGPGGFIECFVNYRKTSFQGNKDNIYCITLKPDKVDIPGWKKIREFMNSKKRLNINILYGKDGTGNLYNIENIIDFAEKIEKKMDFVTADGGFDYSTNFNYQEQMSFQLIYSEMVTALTILKKGGNFVLKIFDIFTIITLQYIFVLSNFFEEVIITKPFTSRPANSERYLVCKNFQGIKIEVLNNLHRGIHEWKLITQKKRYVNSLFYFKVPTYFKKLIRKFNLYLCKNQVENILNTLICKNFKRQQIDSLIRSQIIYCIYWAKKFNQPINYKSSYYKAFQS